MPHTIFDMSVDYLHTPRPSRTLSSRSNPLKFSLYAVAWLLIVQPVAHAQSITDGGKVYLPAPPPPPKPGDADDGFGLVAKSFVDYTYQPFTQEKPYGEANCGAVDLPIHPGSQRGYRGKISGYLPFAKYSANTIYKHVHFSGDGDNAIGCMILLSKVMERRLHDKLLSITDYGEPILFGWRDSLFLKYDPLSDTKLIWIPVMPNADERLNIDRFLQKSAHHFANTIGKSLDDWRTSRFKLTTGYLNHWVTVSVSKDEDGTLSSNVVSGMAIY